MQLEHSRVNAMASVSRPWHEQLRDARRVQGLSQRELEERTGVRQAHLSRIENGALDPRLSCIEQVARGLGYACVLVPRRELPAMTALLRGIDEAGDGQPRSAVQMLLEGRVDGS